MDNDRASDAQAALPQTAEALEALIRERMATLSSQVQILNALDYPIVRIYPDDAMEFMNNAFFEYAEVPGLDRPAASDLLRREYAGRTVLDYILPDDRERFESLKARARERRFTDAAAKFVVGVKGEFTFVSQAGRQTPVSLSITYAMIYDKYQLNFIDITERKRVEEALQKTAAELARSNVELEQFAYVASHDLQEPLRMVSSYTQLLAKRYGDLLDQDAREFIDYAVDGATRMQRLINDLLTYSRVATRGKPLEAMDSHAALGEAINNLGASIEENHAIVTTDDLPMVKADYSQLVQVFQNLVGNAIKFRGEDPPHVHVSACRDGEKWVFSVSDNGIGIAPEYYDQIFQIFQRLHGADRYPGTGIGLALCKRIAERHGGTIWVESEPDKGSVFYFTVPV